MVFFIEIWKCWLVYGEAIYYLNILDSITLQPSYTLIRITECLFKFYMANRTYIEYFMQTLTWATPTPYWKFGLLQ